MKYIRTLIVCGSILSCLAQGMKQGPAKDNYIIKRIPAADRKARRNQRKESTMQSRTREDQQELIAIVESGSMAEKNRAMLALRKK